MTNRDEQLRGTAKPDAAAEAKPQPFLDTRFTHGNLQFSPDGKWVAYESDETGRNEIYVVPYPGPGGKSQVSNDGGTQPRWNRNGRELFFRSGAKMMAVDVETGATFRAGIRTVLFRHQRPPNLRKITADVPCAEACLNQGLVGSQSMFRTKEQMGGQSASSTSFPRSVLQSFI